MPAAHRHFDTGTTLVIVTTLFLFIAALVTKGLTHDLLLEGGVFLVSVKLIIMGYKNSVAAMNVEQRLEEIRQLLQSRPETTAKE